MATRLPGRCDRASWGNKMTLVAVTGWGQEHDQRRSAEAGFDRHMTKPVDPLVLEAFLDTIAYGQTPFRNDAPWQSVRDDAASLGTAD